MKRVPLLLLAVLAGCSSGDSTEPEPSDAPRAGRYGYSFSATGLTAGGIMVLTYATQDSIAGHFEVDGYEPELALGFRNTDAYLVYAHVVTGGLTQQRLRPDGESLVCERARYVIGSDIRVGTCVTTYQGP